MSKQEQLKKVFKTILKQVVEDARTYLNTDSIIDEYTNTLLKEVSIRVVLK